MKHHHTNHMWMMALACGGAFLLILVLPFIGLSKNWAVGISIAVMIGLHLWMMRGHLKHNEHRKHKGGKMDCCQNNLLTNKVEENKRVSWKTILTVLIIIGLLIVSSLSLMIH